MFLYLGLLQFTYVQSDDENSIVIGPDGSDVDTCAQSKPDISSSTGLIRTLLLIRCAGAGGGDGGGWKLVCSFVECRVSDVVVPVRRSGRVTQRERRQRIRTAFNHTQP